MCHLVSVSQGPGVALANGHTSKDLTKAEEDGREEQSAPPPLQARPFHVRPFDLAAAAITHYTINILIALHCTVSITD